MRKTSPGPTYLLLAVIGSVLAAFLLLPQLALSVLQAVGLSSLAGSGGTINAPLLILIPTAFLVGVLLLPGGKGKR